MPDRLKVKPQLLLPKRHPKAGGRDDA